MSNSSFFVYGDKAYRSEIALYRKEGVTSEECEVVSAPAETAELYRLASGHGELILYDFVEAARHLRSSGFSSLRSVAVV
jgi:hypothetical protein